MAAVASALLLLPLWAAVPAGAQQAQAEVTTQAPAELGMSIYAADESGELRWYRHHGVLNGAYDWQVDGFGTQVGDGWLSNVRMAGGGDGVVYAIPDDGRLLWFQNSEPNHPSAAWVEQSGAEIGPAEVDWNEFTAVVAAGESVLYAVTGDGQLLWFRHDGTEAWLPGSGEVIGDGFDRYTHLFGHSGIFYGVTADGGLQWWRHHGWLDGTVSWSGTGENIGDGWDTVDPLWTAGSGVLYGVDGAGMLRWYRHLGWQTGEESWLVENFGNVIGDGWDRFHQIVLANVGPRDITAPPAEPPETVEASVYWMHGEYLVVGAGRAAAVPDTLESALEALLARPEQREIDLGHGTAIPEGTALLGVSLADGVATIDLSSEFETGGGTLAVQARLAQLVYTATQFPTVDSVVLWIEGEPVETFTGEGLVIEGPLTREDFTFMGQYEMLAAPILLEGPRPFDVVSSPVRLFGSSNTFEANLLFEVVDTEGNEIVPEFFATASAGTGTRGTFDVTMEYSVAQPTEAVLWAYERSARDGSRINEVQVPLTLLP